MRFKQTNKQTNCWGSRAARRSGMDTILCGASAVLPLAARLRGRGFLSQTGWLATRLVFWSPASPSDVRAGRSHQRAFTGRFHVSFNEETAGLAAGYKQRADWNTQIWISCIRRQVRTEASLSLRGISEHRCLQSCCYSGLNVLRVWSFQAWDVLVFIEGSRHTDKCKLPKEQ